MKNILGLFTLLILSSTLYAQEIEVKGKVTDHKGNSITATIIVKKSKKTMTTDDQGFFAIKCNLKDKLKITAKNYASKTIKISGDKFLAVELKKSGIDYSQYSSFTEIMTSIFSGIVAMDNTTIYIIKREAGQQKRALLILDGREVNAGSLISLPTNFIKSIKVLRESHETIIYGQRGLDGVLVVTTNVK